MLPEKKRISIRKISPLQTESRIRRRRRGQKNNEWCENMKIKPWLQHRVIDMVVLDLLPVRSLYNESCIRKESSLFWLSNLTNKQFLEYYTELNNCWMFLFLFLFFFFLHFLLSFASAVALQFTSFAATNLISISPCIPIFTAAIYMFHLNARRLNKTK